MKRFAFPLETARTWRLRRLEVEEIRLRQLYLERDGIQQRIRGLRQELADEEKLLSGGALEARELVALDDFRGHVRATEQRLNLEMRNCDQRIAAQKKQLVEARRHFELLDRLREKALLEWRAGHAREQEQLAAELYLARLAREIR